MWSELLELKKRLTRWLVLFAVVIFAFFFIGVDTIQVREWAVPIPSTESVPISVAVLEKIKNDLLPEGVELIAVTPMSAFSTQLSISILLAFIVTIPVLLTSLVRYISPALYPSERRILHFATIPTSILFLGGVVFAYVALMPTTFKVLYGYTMEAGIIPYFAVDQFIGWVLLLTLSSSIAFLMPIVMLGLTGIGLVPSSFWRSRWRHAVLTVLIASAIITPDGTGVTMAVLSAPVVVLYFAGATATSYIDRRRLSLTNP